MYVCVSGAKKYYFFGKIWVRAKWMAAIVSYAAHTI